MANRLGINPMTIDTPGTGVLYDTDLRNAHFEFIGYTTGETDKVVVEDRFGNRVWEGTGHSDLSNVVSFTCEWIYGFQVPILTSGVLYVYFK
jgi:hypothetical protein